MIAAGWRVAAGRASRARTSPNSSSTAQRARAGETPANAPLMVGAPYAPQ